MVENMLLILAAIAVTSFTLCSTENTYYITPTPDTPCPAKPCHTLSQYAEQYFQNFSTNLTLVFLPGDHTLDRTVSIGTHSTYVDWWGNTTTHQPEHYYFHSSVTLLGSPSLLPEVTSKIVCTRPAGFAFSGITELHISGLAFISCGHDDSAAVNIFSVWNVVISNCSFQNNTNGLPWPKSTAGNYIYGGAIFVYNSTLTLATNLFRNNHADVGGALHVWWVKAVILVGNTFQNNSADYGGALNAAISNILTLSRNIFQNNSADYDGGAVYAYQNNTLTLSENTFLYNFAVTSGGALIIHENNTLTLSENIFQNNSADSDGGALNAYRNSVLTLTENTFQYNSADKGGAVSADTRNTLILSGNTFQNNSADSDGGALNALTTNNITLSENTFQYNSADYGGALVSDGDTILTLSKNTFRYNSANSSGGALYAYATILTLSENTFQYNSADYGGALVSDGDTILTLSKNTFRYNSANASGGVLYAYKTILTLSENTFQYNSAAYGGALFVDINNTVTLSVNTFQNNSADFNGGALTAYENNTLTLSGNTFLNNSADTGGAVLSRTNNNLTLLENTFWYNSANFSGGVLYAHNTILTLSENTFQYNSAAYGGALFVDINNTVTLSVNTFQNNSADHNGGALTAYENNTLTLSESTFQNNSAYFGGALFAHINNTLTLTKSAFQCNSAYSSGGAFYANKNNTFTLSQDTFESNSAGFGGALYAYTSNTLTLSDSTFQNNTADYDGGALLVRQSTMNLTNNNLTRNTAKSNGGAIVCLSDSTISLHGSHKLHRNTAQHGGGIAASECLVVLAGDSILENNKAEFGGGLHAKLSNVSGYAYFNNNSASRSGGGIYASRSTVYFEQSTTLVGNSAMNGGGMLFTDDSKLYLQLNTTLSFTNNTALKKGGALKVENSDPLSYCADSVSCGFFVGSDCFFQIQTHKKYEIISTTNISDITELHNVRIYFTANTASEAGAALYGGSVDSCNLNFINLQLDGFFELYRCPVSGKVFDYIANSEEQSLDISSDPLYICTCEGKKPNCNASSVRRSAYPGGTIEVPIIVYGQRNGTTPAVIRNITPREEVKIDNPQNTQSITDSCTLLNYTVHTRALETTQEISLYAEGPCSPKERTVSTPTNVIKVRVFINRCPHGFELSEMEPVCICAQRLERFTNRCRIYDGKIERKEFWVGYEQDNTSDGLILHSHCPFDYCTSYAKYIAIDDSDEQCSSNRTGRLCGKCAQNFSLILGTNRCWQCSDDNLWLIAAFGIAGVILVLLLLLLRLTVAVGTINGLVFYANILAVNSATFFRPQNTNVLTVFIAWLNLDLGIETCFYDGMDAYTKVWLQFVFPVYVWALVGIIILVSHYSSKVATVLGRNPVAVLATLFLLSYTKFLRTIIAALSYTLLEYPNNSRIAVWLYDANIGYLSNKHIPLFTAAVICLIVLFLPYTLFLIFSQWLRTKSGRWKLFYWVNSHRVLPFLDAYHAPYTDKHRYWTGLMLLVRCILFFLFAFNAFGDPSINVLAIGSVTVLLIIISALGLFGTRVYKTWHLNVLELSFIANLSILALATLYIRSTGGNQNAVTFTSISIAFATFFGIIAYHSVQQIKDTPQLWRRMFPQYYNYELVPQTDEDSDTAPPSPPDPSDGCATVSHVSLRGLIDYSELRVPCMEMDD